MLDSDIELADILKISIGNGALHTQGNSQLFDAINPQQHPRLAARTANSHNRRLVANHLKATLCGAFLKDIYEDVSAYFQEILAAAAKNGLDPNRLIGEHKVTFQANDVLKAGNWNEVVRLVAESVFRRLENERSTKDLIQKMSAKLALNIPQALIDAAVPYFEIRHLLVHADCKADQKFCSAYPQFNLTPGSKVKLDYQLLQSSRSAIFDLVKEFDKQIVQVNLVAANEMQP